MQTFFCDFMFPPDTVSVISLFEYIIYRGRTTFLPSVDFVSREQIIERRKRKKYSKQSRRQIAFKTKKGKLLLF